MKCLASCGERLALYLPCLVGMGVILPHYLVSREEWKNGAKLSHIWGHLVTSILSRAKNDWRTFELRAIERFFCSFLSLLFFELKCVRVVPPPTPTRAKMACSATRVRLKRCLTINHYAYAPTQHSQGETKPFYEAITKIFSIWERWYHI